MLSEDKPHMLCSRSHQDIPSPCQDMLYLLHRQGFRIRQFAGNKIQRLSIFHYGMSAI